MAAKLNSRMQLLLGGSLVCVGIVPTQTLAQASDGNQLADIVVTAQRREQNVQDVPIAVTALGPAALAANRVVSVTDLSGLAPGVQVVPAAGGAQTPAFSMRGVTSYGVVPGSDKEVSIYLDGVYISSPRGSIFNLPDMSGIEVLRGPQGTLFGRNATAGAISMTTRDPNGKIGATAVFTVGNYNQFGTKFTISTPQIGPFSAYATFDHQYQRGDVRNLASGTIWNRTASPSEQGVISSSPKYLGTTNATSYFFALKFQPTDNFKMVYKHDHDSENNSPEATVALNYDPALSGPLLGTVFANHPELFDPGGKRPDAASNGFAITGQERVFGHSLTTTWDIADNITLKNITAWRKSFVFSAVPYDGLAGFTLTGADSAAFGAGGALAGATFGIVAIQPTSTSRQFSDELQVNYRSRPVTLTAGVMWFHGTDFSGGLTGFNNTILNFPIFNGVIPLGNLGDSYNDGKSAAVYAQAELHVTHKLDFILGGRVTKDNKSGHFDATDPTQASYVPGVANVIVPFTYVNTKPSWLIGVNYKPNDDVLLYGKASTANVSGGSASGVPFNPETATSFELGAKAEWFDRRLRTNLSIYTVTYKYLQLAEGQRNFSNYLNTVGSGLNPPVNNLGSLIATFVAQLGLNYDPVTRTTTNDPAPATARGVEFEAVGSLGHGVTTGGNLGFSHVHYSYVSPILLASNNGQFESSTLKPDWTGSLWGQYESKPFANGSHISARLDANWHSRILQSASPDKVAAVFRPYNYAPAAWVVNGRMALSDINIAGVDAEVALWGKNLLQNRDVVFTNNLGVLISASFQPARTLGVDVKIHY